MLMGARARAGQAVDWIVSTGWAHHLLAPVEQPELSRKHAGDAGVVHLEMAPVVAVEGGRAVSQSLGIGVSEAELTELPELRGQEAGQ